MPRRPGQHRRRRSSQKNAARPAPPPPAALRPSSGPAPPPSAPPPAPFSPPPAPPPFAPPPAFRPFSLRALLCVLSLLLIAGTFLFFSPSIVSYASALLVGANVNSHVASNPAFFNACVAVNSGRGRARPHPFALAVPCRSVNHALHAALPASRALVLWEPSLTS